MQEACFCSYFPYDKLQGNGYRLVTHELRRRNHAVNHKRVARVIAEHGLGTKRQCRFVRTDAYSRKIVGYAISMRIDTPLALTALKAAIDSRRPARAAGITRIAAAKARFSEAPVGAGMAPVNRDLKRCAHQLLRRGATTVVLERLVLNGTASKAMRSSVDERD